jgi:hypothetical protein
MNELPRRAVGPLVATTVPILITACVGMVRSPPYWLRGSPFR